MTNALRSGGLLAIAIGIATFWIVTQTVQRANASNPLVIHTQQVLSAVEAVGTDLADAERGVRQFMDTGAIASLQPLAEVERALVPDLARVTSLTSDNPSQQSRLQQLNTDAHLALSALRQLADTAASGRGLTSSEITAHVRAFDDARATMRAIRTEEERLLDERARANEGAVYRLQPLAVALGILAALLGGWAYALTSRRARRAQEHATALTRENASLEAQVDAHAAELRASNARLQSIIDSAVDAITISVRVPRRSSALVVK